MAYAPDPDTFYCRPRDPENPADIADLGGTLNEPRFRFVVFPTDPRWREILRESAGERRYRSVASDEHFSVYEFQ